MITLWYTRPERKILSRWYKNISFVQRNSPISRRRNERENAGEGEGEVVESAEGKDRKESKRGTRFHKAILRTLFSHAHVESKARPISYGDSLTSSVHHRICLYRRRYWQPSFDEACRGGWLGSSMTGLRRLCAPRTCAMLVSSLFLSLSLSFFRYICLHLVRLRTSVCARNKGWRKESGEGGRKKGWDARELGLVRYQISR